MCEGGKGLYSLETINQESTKSVDKNLILSTDSTQTRFTKTYQVRFLCQTMKLLFLDLNPFRVMGEGFCLFLLLKEALCSLQNNSLYVHVPGFG